MDDALSAALEGARRNPEAGRAFVDAVKAAVEAAPKPKRLTWGEIWRRQQSSWAGQSSPDCEPTTDNQARAQEAAKEPR